MSKKLGGTIEVTTTEDTKDNSSPALFPTTGKIIRWLHLISHWDYSTRFISKNNVKLVFKAQGWPKMKLFLSYGHKNERKKKSIEIACSTLSYSPPENFYNRIHTRAFLIDQ